MNYVCLDGQIVPGDQPHLRVDNRGYRYGDALFETMKVRNNRIIFEEWHFDRLLNGLRLIDLALPALVTPEKLANDILQLCERNGCTQLARVRLSVSRGNGAMTGPGNAQYIIESVPITDNGWKENGYKIDIHPTIKLGCDPYANLKSANYLRYVMAARFAKDRQLDDVLLLNMFQRIAESSIANVFIVKGKKLFTPALSEGCVAGIARRWVIKNFGAIETTLILDDILTADEIFLTNAIKGIRWVRQYGDKIYESNLSPVIYEKLQQEIDNNSKA